MLKSKSHYVITSNIEWDQIYNLALADIHKTNTNSLIDRFIAKYNFYRSMAFIFLCLFIYIAFFIGNIPLCWYAFHNKYERYWAFCGKEAVTFIILKK